MRSFGTLVVSLLFIHIKSVALATTYDQADALFESGQAPFYSDLLSLGEVVDRAGRCVTIFAKDEVESKAFAATPLTGEFGPNVFISFEYFEDGDTDAKILETSGETLRRYWGPLYPSHDRILQQAKVARPNHHLMEYRVASGSDGKSYLVRKYYADGGVYVRHQRYYVQAFEGIEYCWIGNLVQQPDP